MEGNKQAGLLVCQHMRVWLDSGCKPWRQQVRALDIMASHQGCAVAALAHVLPWLLTAAASSHREVRCAALAAVCAAAERERDPADGALGEALREAAAALAEHAEAVQADARALPALLRRSLARTGTGGAAASPARCARATAAA